MQRCIVRCGLFLFLCSCPVLDTERRQSRAHGGNMVRIFDPYAIALSVLVGGVGFGMTFFFNTRVSSWGVQEIAYPALAMAYVYARNARFFESDGTTCEKILEGSTANATSDGGTPAANTQRVQAPSSDATGLILVTGAPFAAPADGALAVVFFFASWCANSERCLPSILAVAARYRGEGITFTGVTQESEDDLRYFIEETYKRPLRSVTFLADEQGLLTKGYQGVHQNKAIPHCYVVKGTTGEGFGEIEWHGHPTRLEAALGYIMDCAEEEEDGDGDGAGTVEGAAGGPTDVPVALPVAIPLDES